MCGGCAFQDHAYNDQIAAKAHALTDLWQAHYPAGIAVVPSPEPYAYRTRMDYVTTKERFGLRMRKRWNYIVELETCHLIPPEAFDCVHALWLESRVLGIPDYNIRSHTGFLRYLVVRRSPQNTLLIAAVTADGEYDAAMGRLAESALQFPSVVSFHWLRNATMTDVSFGDTVYYWGNNVLPMQVGEHTLHIGPNTFFQNNVHLLNTFLETIVEAVTSFSQPDASSVAGRSGTIADLYSGVGLIALYLAKHVNNIVAVESHSESATLAEENAKLNGIINITTIPEDVETFLQAQPAHAFDCIVADPPRTGLGAKACAELLRLAPHRIVYISCNPLTHLSDIEHLLADYRLTMLQGLDMFPHTPHIESLAILDR